LNEHLNKQSDHKDQVDQQFQQHADKHSEHADHISNIKSEFTRMSTMMKEMKENQAHVLNEHLEIKDKQDRVIMKGSGIDIDPETYMNKI